MPVFYITQSLRETDLYAVYYRVPGWYQTS